MEEEKLASLEEKRNMFTHVSGIVTNTSITNVVMVMIMIAVLHWSNWQL